MGSWGQTVNSPDCGEPGAAGVGGNRKLIFFNGSVRPATVQVPAAFGLEWMLARRDLTSWRW